MIWILCCKKGVKHTHTRTHCRAVITRVFEVNRDKEGG